MLRNLIRVAPAIVGIAFLSACASDANENAEHETASQAEETAQPMVSTDAQPYTKDLVASGTGSMLEGTVQLAPNVDGTSLHVVAHGVPAGEHAWHIHRGTCTDSGPVVVAFTDTDSMTGIGQALIADADGNVDTRVDVPNASLDADSLEMGPFSLHVHEKSGTDHGPTIACADLNR